MNKNHNDRRLSPRIPTDVRCWLERESITLLGTVTNMSFGGLFLRTPVILPEGHSVHLKIDLGQGMVEVQGYVVWTISSKDDKRYSGLGIRIDKIIDGRPLLEHYVEHKPLARPKGDAETN